LSVATHASVHSLKCLYIPPFLLQRLVALEKQVAAASSAPAGKRGRAVAQERRPRAPLVLYQAPRRSETGSSDTQAEA